jgi:hypothetical protein
MIDLSGHPINRENRQQDLKRQAREKVARGAAAGIAPSSYVQADLEWAFGSGDDALAEIDRLEQLAAQAAAEKRARAERTYSASRVRGLAEQIVRQQEEAEKQARMDAAIVEARRRLGLPTEPQNPKEIA